MKTANKMFIQKKQMGIITYLVWHSCGAPSGVSQFNFSHNFVSNFVVMTDFRFWPIIY